MSSPPDAPLQTGRSLGLYSCPTCGRVSRRAGPEVAGAPLNCPRCDTPLHHRKPHSLEHAWALTIAALLLYLPANLLPVMTTVSITTGTVSHTILGGIHELWTHGDWGLAVIVFVASIGVPIVKLLAILVLLVTAGRASRWRSRERTTLHRWIDAVGHWSMLDVFVVVLLVGMINFAPLAGVRPEPGLLAFGAVVVLTILAVESFDPRLLWPEPGSGPATPTDAPPASPPHE
ncbi:MAG: paraquat-inducible protein A [Rhizobacter sp.]